ncbi:phage protein Gp27 family protein [Sphingobium aquiterrae]|uniref:phage protein Gp27 family protein n=1 Tax=Sphingobium aquiterrae TaxID=2038656 RepID=UPI003015B1A9
MARRSSIDQLDPAIRLEVDAAIKRGVTIDKIVDMLHSLGEDVSRSAVGRYSKHYAQFAARQRDMMSVAEAFGREFGASDNSQGKLLIQLITSIAARAAMSRSDDDEIGAQELSYLARSVKDIVLAAKTDADRDAKIREEAAKEAMRKAASIAENAARSAGASEATIDIVKRRILGLD